MEEFRNYVRNLSDAQLHLMESAVRYEVEDRRGPHCEHKQLEMSRPGYVRCLNCFREYISGIGRVAGIVRKD